MKTEKNYQKYAKILNNLLTISSRGDNAVFSKMNSLNTDLHNLVSLSDLEKIFNKENFKVKLINKINSLNLSDLKQLNSFNDVISFCLNQGLVISPHTKKILKADLKFGINQIIEQATKKTDLFIKRWKINDNTIFSTYQETNIWPLFIGTFYVGLNDATDNIIYAPLILKEVEIVIENNQIYLESRSSTVILNDKINFLLSHTKSIDLSDIIFENNCSLKKASEVFLSKFFHLFSNEKNFVNITDKFINFRAKSLFPKISNLTIFSGITVLACNPSGGKLRKIVLDLINNNKIENLISVDMLKNYKAIGEQKLFARTPLIRILPTDVSQEKAILASLDHSSIIIGPPGTGKSQTIANILLNIIANKKKVLFISQKKTALDVVINRMKEISFLILQFTNSNKSNKSEKKEFYDILQTFFNHLKQIPENYKDYPTGKAFFNNLELQYANAKKEMAKRFGKNFVLKNLFAAFKNLLKKESISNFFENWNLEVQNFYKFVNKNKRFLTSSEFPKYWNASNFNKYYLAKTLGAVKSKIFIFKKYDSKFLSNYSIVNNLKQLPRISQLDINAIRGILVLENYESFEIIKNYLKISELYEQWSLKESKLDNTNKEQIQKVIWKTLIDAKNKLKEKLLDKEYKKRFKSLTGRVVRGATAPNIFVSLFKDILQDCFSVIVGTPEVLSGFVDFKTYQYDYVIFDESSQIFFEKAIPFISIAKKTIIAGDDQQMQPSNWFGKRFQSEDHFDESSEFDSLLEWAKQQNLPMYYLEMNYRSSSSELVLFSSKHFYNSELKAIDSNRKINQHPLEVVDINGKWENSLNISEAEAMLDLASKFQNTYESIILLTFNMMQRDYVLSQIIENKPDLYNKILEGKISIKNIENIQGDEADLVIASVCYDKTTMLHGVYVVTNNGKNALNVAITRAKEKFIILKSINSKDVFVKNENNENLMTFKLWLEYLELNAQERKLYAPIFEVVTKNIDSNFEIEVIEWIQKIQFNRQIKIQNQFSVGSYSIDIALIDARTSKFLLGIEVDGYQYHSGFKKLVADKKRQNYIEAKGYPIYRITEKKWNFDREKIAEYLNFVIK